MKKLLGVFYALVCVAGAVRADSVTFRESYSERVVRYCDPDPEFGCGYFETENGSFSGGGSITFPGLSAVGLDEIAGGEASLGGASISFSQDDPGVTATANRLVVKLGEEDVDDDGNPIFYSYGSITFTRNGNVLSFTFTVSDAVGGSIAAADYAEPEDPETLATQAISSSVEFKLRLGEFDFTRQVYYKGTASYRKGLLGTGEEAETVTLATVSISGAADYTKPTLSITTPKPNQRITNETFLVTGKAADNGELAEIRVRVNDGEFETVELPETGSVWTTEVTLRPGINTIEAFSIDAEENVSATAKVQCFRVLTSALTLIVGEGGTVMGVLNRQVLEVGSAYKATAKPGPTNLFSHWRNSVLETISTNLMLSFQMEEDLVLEAHFIPTPSVLNLAVDPGNTVMGVTHRQVLVAGRRYTATAKPGPTNLFSYWSSSASGPSSNAVLNFPASPDLTLDAHFIPNPWLPNKGTYNGLFLPDADVATTNAGFLTMQLTDKGKVTGKVTQGAQTRSFMGQLDLNGNALIQIPTAPALALQLAFDLANGSGLVEGSVSNAAWPSPSPLHAELQVPAVALVGKHTFAIPGARAVESTNRPAGDGAGVITVNANGSITLAGNLGEGTPLTAGSGLSKSGRLPVHAVQFAGRGFFIGWLSVSTSSLPLTVTGPSLTWFKPPGLARQMTYLGGFNEQNKSLQGARYTPPLRGSNVLNWPVGIVMLDGGRLTNTISNVLTVAGPTLAAPGNTNKILLTLTASSGKLSGSFLHPVSSKSTPLNGYVLQMPGGDVGKGWFVRSNESGYLDLHKAAP